MTWHIFEAIALMTIAVLWWGWFVLRRGRHTHDFVELARTYAEPAAPQTLKNIAECDGALVVGATTILLQCECGAVEKFVLLGKEEPEPLITCGVPS